jgi:hypothetical protein
VGEHVGVSPRCSVLILSCAALVCASTARAGSTSGESSGRRGAELIRAQARALETPPLAPGQQAELSLILLEAPDRAMPLAVRIEGGALELVENRLDWSAVVDPLALQPRLRAPFRAPAEPGRYEVRASVDYSTCSEQWCRAKHGELSWTVVVEAAD